MQLLFFVKIPCAYDLFFFIPRVNPAYSSKLEETGKDCDWAMVTSLQNTTHLTSTTAPNFT